MEAWLGTASGESPFCQSVEGLLLRNIDLATQWLLLVLLFYTQCDTYSVCCVTAWHDFEL